VFVFVYASGCLVGCGRSVGVKEVRGRSMVCFGFFVCRGGFGRGGDVGGGGNAM